MKEIEELRGSIATLTALVTALVETHPDPAAIRARFADLSEQAMAMMLAANTDDSTNAADAALQAMNEWLEDLATSTGKRMKERRIARRCKNCGESMPNGAFMCAKCGKATPCRPSNPWFNCPRVFRGPRWIRPRQILLTY